MPEVEHLLQQLSRERSQRENQAREAGELLRQRTSGAGQLVAAEVHRFGNPFVFRPDVSYGSEIITPPNTDLYALPRCTGSVLRWTRNDRGFYVGAYVYVDVVCEVVDGAFPTEPPTVVVEHFFHFASVAFKELGSNANAQVQDETLPTHDTEY